MVVVLDERGAVVAGTRIHRRAPGHALPVERILATHSGVRRGLDWRQPSGVGEVAGLWASPALAGTGIGGPIVATAVAHASALGMAHLVGFAHQYNRFTRRVGFEPDRSLGEHAYPDGRYRSTVNWCDALGLTSADSFFRGMILDLRRRVLRGERLWLTPGESGAAASSGA
jgi:RimJ/RimL family protein N-acetyltransferase